MDRRNFIVGGAALAAAGCATPGRAMAQAQRSYARELKGDYLDLTTPKGNMIAWARLLGNTDERSTKYGWAQGIVQGIRPGEAARDLVGFTMLSCARLLPHESGIGWRKVLREIGLYTDLKTGAILEEWENPYFGTRVKVVPIANDPFNHTITEYYPDPPSYGGLNTFKPPKRPLLFDWRRRGDDLNMFSHINLFYPSALQPEKWPRESSGPFAQVTEAFLYQIDWRDMQDPSKTSVEYNGTWARTTPWLPWMLMGPTPGHAQYLTFMGGVNSLEAIDPQLIAYLEKNHPKYLRAPDKWEEPSLSSLEWYSRTQQPAPLPPDGRVPVAPEPELPAWFRQMQQKRREATGG